MKKKLFLLSVLSIFANQFLQAQNRAINFEHISWEDIKLKAKKENKAIFLDAYTSWCGPCKQMAREVFTDDQIADYFNANFINAKIDMEKEEGPQLAKLYSVNAYPSLLFIDAEGKLISKRIGAMEVAEFLDYGKKSVSGESLDYLTSQYKSGNRSFEFMKKYMTRMEGLRENTKGIIEEYFSKTPQSKWQTPENWYFIYRYIKDEQSPVFKYVFKNKKSFEQKFTADSLSDYFVNVYRNTIQKTANSVFPVEDLQELKEKIRQMDFEGTAELELECDLAIADRSKDMKGYADAIEAMLTQYPKADKDRQLEWVNEVCWKLLQKSSDPYVLLKAAKLAEVAMETSNPAFMDTYANLLFETGNIDKAIEVEEKILTLLKAHPSHEFSIADCEKQLERFKRKKG